MRNSVTLIDSTGAPKTGQTVEVYYYDANNPPTYRGTKIGNMTETATGGSYYIDLAQGAKVVVVVNGQNVEELVGVKFWGDSKNISEGDLDFAKTW